MTKADIDYIRVDLLKRLKLALGYTSDKAMDELTILEKAIERINLLEKEVTELERQLHEVAHR